MAQSPHTRCGWSRWNFGGNSMRRWQHALQKMLPQRRQWCRVRRSALCVAHKLDGQVNAISHLFPIKSYSPAAILLSHKFNP